ncbi:MAG: hypothetical protein IPF64_12425 [Flavobacteriales bacterium]|nr:hypothetical protein [Flavobacteriales bacterium]
MVRKPDLAQENSVRSGLQAAGVEDDRVQQVLSMGKASNLPLGLRTDSALAANAASVKNYNAHKVCTYADEAGTKVLVQVPVNENYHMPEDLRTSQDLYRSYLESAVEMTSPMHSALNPARGRIGSACDRPRS